MSLLTSQIYFCLREDTSSMVNQLLVSLLGKIPWQKQLKERRVSFGSLHHHGESLVPGAGGDCYSVSTDLSPQVGATHTQGRSSHLS